LIRATRDIPAGVVFLPLSLSASNTQATNIANKEKNNYNKSQRSDASGSQPKAAAI